MPRKVLGRRLQNDEVRFHVYLTLKKSEKKLLDAYAESLRVLGDHPKPRLAAAITQSLRFGWAAARGEFDPHSEHQFSEAEAFADGLTIPGKR